MRWATAGLMGMLAACHPAPPGPAEPEAPIPEPTADAPSNSQEASDDAGPWGTTPPADWTSLGDLDPAAWNGSVPTTKSVTLFRRSAVWLHPEGPAWGPEQSSAFDPPATFPKVEDPYGLRIVAEFGGVRMLLYASPEDLAMIVRRDGPLHEGPGAPAPEADARVELRVGAVLDVQQRRPGWVEVVVRDGPHELAGWLPQDVVGVEFEPPEVDPLPPPGRQLRLAAPGTIVARDGTTVVYTLGDTQPQWWVSAQQRRGRLTRVRYDPPCDGRWRVEGYVPTPRRKRREHPDPSSSPCPAGAGVLPMQDDAEPRVRLGARTILLERPAGQPVGITLRPVEVVDRGDDTYWLPSPWGPLPVAIADPQTTP
jgi:hypothetical protein